MQRRAMVAAIGIAPMLAKRAFSQARRPRIAIVVLRLPGRDEESSLPRTATAALAELGWIDGRTATVLVASADGDISRLPAVAREVVAGDPDVILAGGGTVTAALATVTSELPIVMSPSAFDPVEKGWAQSYNRPGGNVTGLTFAADDAVAKQLEILREIAPASTHVGFLRTRDNASTRAVAERAVGAAGALGLRASVRDTGDQDISAAIEALRAQGADALLALVDPVMDGLRRQIAEVAIRHRMPTAGQLVWYATDGFLFAFAADLTTLHRRGADYADRIVRGARPGDLPIERPTKFTLTVNLRTARALGLDVAASTLARADEVIE